MPFKRIPSFTAYQVDENGSVRKTNKKGWKPVTYSVDTQGYYCFTAY